MFIFYRCHRSWAAETQNKCERDWKYLNYTCAKSKLPVMEKLTNGALVTPSPDDIINPPYAELELFWLQLLAKSLQAYWTHANKNVGKWKKMQIYLSRIFKTTQQVKG